MSLLRPVRALLCLVTVSGVVAMPGVLRGQGAATTSPGATTTVQLPAAPLLPERFGRWVAVAAPEAGGTPDVLQDGTAQAIAQEDGLKRTATGSYRAGTATLEIGALQFGDATGAVAAYTYLRGHDLVESAADPARRGNTNVAAGANRALVREGPTLLVVRNAAGGAVPSGELLALADMLPKLSGPAGLPPLLPTYLPAKDLLPRTVEYALGPKGYRAEEGALPPELMGFDKAGEAVTAQYRGGATGSGKLTLLLLPTPEIAGARGRALESWLNSPEAANAAMGTVRLRRIGPLLALASNGFTPEQSKALLDGLHLRTEVTWNKPVPPEFHAEVRKTASLLTSIIVFCGVAGVGTLLLGLFLGFGRAWIRVLLGKPAATEPEFLRLDLRGGSSASTGRK